MNDHRFYCESEIPWDFLKNHFSTLRNGPSHHFPFVSNIYPVSSPCLWSELMATHPSSGCNQSMKVKVKVKSLSRVWLFATLWIVAHQIPPSMGFSRQEYWSGLLFPSPGDLPNPGIEHRSPNFRQTLQPLSHQGSKQPIATPKSPSHPTLPAVTYCLALAQVQPSLSSLFSFHLFCS